MPNTSDQLFSFSICELLFTIFTIPILNVPGPICGQSIFRMPYHYTHKILSNAGISVCASQKLNTSFGPVIKSFGVKPLKKLVIPSFRNMLPTILNPLSGFSKFRFCILVLMTSRGAETMREADAPHMEATKFWDQEAVL